MDKVDKTIESICDWIQKELEKTSYCESEEISDMVKALAELVTARTQCGLNRKMNYIPKRYCIDGCQIVISEECRFS